MLPAVTSVVLFRQAQSSFPKICAILGARPQLRYASDDCGPDEPDSANRKNLDADKFPFPKKYMEPPSMWENPDCCVVPCEVVRHDILYLKEKPKKYTRTWVECKDIEKMVYVCTGEIEPPEIMPRVPSPCRDKKDPERCPRCIGDETKLGLMTCKRKPNLVGPCVKIRLPCCVKARDPPVCSKVVIHSCCQKRCTMYPSYSECKRDKPPARHPVECFCLRIPSMCEVYDQFRRFALK